MKAKIIRITDSDRFITFLFWLEGKNYPLMYTGKQYRNYEIWSQFKVGDWVEGLEWKDEKKKLIDADSPVHLA
ncbi:MAG: hypothetical protein A2431_00625 [Candidatus Zambryskibacteria bacterium RIFOXYC1_FULL_39_10]|uniref:Uncharacterized protein n=1 Tax=Candidatus Zambryskibacteria bacterium RIFOXYC1_FULL_39_10 TaxID=1802779 RepID=A0A1G2UZ87_9BACT|nr:MAG: hypothetical protein A2431_00625 [Candidatus Zambryskibacteria bacterium RIFOXYC1_FULL_39_10]OHB15648.1 MAG: hypothetical protein A2605_02485 [Candidatus Zambryskibacteria bacterium RIFOXYD1_FULL_39_35]